MIKDCTTCLNATFEGGTVHCKERGDFLFAINNCGWWEEKITLEISPCAFCGKMPEIAEVSFGDGPYERHVFCPNCDFPHSEESFRHGTDAIKSWNEEQQALLRWKYDAPNAYFEWEPSGLIVEQVLINKRDFKPIEPEDVK